VGQLVPGDDPALEGGARHQVRVDTGAVVRHLDDDVAALVVGAQRQHALGRFAGRHPHGRWLDAVVDGVAHQVGERVLDRFEQAAVQLGLPALHRQPHLLAAGRRQVPDHAGQLRPQVLDGLHARLHDALLQLTGDQVEPLGGPGHPGVRGLGDRPDQLVAGQHQLAHQSHERVEQVDVHPDRAVGDAAPARGDAEQLLEAVLLGRRLCRLRSGTGRPGAVVARVAALAVARALGSGGRPSRLGSGRFLPVHRGLPRNDLRCRLPCRRGFRRRRLHEPDVRRRYPRLAAGGRRGGRRAAGNGWRPGRSRTFAAHDEPNQQDNQPDKHGKKHQRKN
jgi:hypothetical protein